MRVLNLTNAETSFYNQQVQALREQEVECATLAVPGREERTDTRSPIDYLRFWVQALREMDDEYDIVHANYGLVAPMALSQRQLPVVLTLWGTDLYGPFGPVSKACARLCDDVIVMSDRMNDDIGTDCAVIPHGVDLERFQPEPTDQARAQVGWEEDAYHVLFPYRPGREVKNYPLAERVVEAVDDELDRPVTLEAVCGVPQSEFTTYMNAADCLLMTSKREGSPNVVKEAMACELPVVSTDVGDVRERLTDVTPSAVRSSETGLADALTDVLTSERRSNGRDEVRDISLDRMGERILAVYEDVLSKQSSTGQPGPLSQETR